MGFLDWLFGVPAGGTAQVLWGDRTAPSDFGSAGFQAINPSTGLPMAAGSGEGFGVDVSGTPYGAVQTDPFDHGSSGSFGSFDSFGGFD